jgi:hypothetical protein
LVPEGEEGREFLHKLQDSMNNDRYSTGMDRTPEADLVTLEELNSMLQKPANEDLESKFVSIDEAVYKLRV